MPIGDRTGANPDTRTFYKTKKTTTTRTRDAVASPLVQLLDGGGGGDDEEQDDRTDATATAADVVDELAVVLRLGALDRAQLVPAVADALRAGWTPGCAGPRRPCPAWPRRVRRRRRRRPAGRCGCAPPGSARGRRCP
ncbi:MAG: hypothetical protein M3Q22_11070, partial [Actinomycetota bacterium]|nr:hypothetical protein [Actinomycetota bacterium]